LGVERAHLLIVNWTVLADLRSIASTDRTELCVLKSSRWVELCLRLTDMHDLLLLVLAKLADLAHYGAVLSTRTSTDWTKLICWLATLWLKLTTLLVAYRTELFVLLTPTLLELTHLLNLRTEWVHRGVPYGTELGGGLISILPRLARRSEII